MTITEPQTAGDDSGNQAGPTEFDLLMESVRAEFDTQFTWDYERGRDGLNRPTKRPSVHSGTSATISTGRPPSTPSA